MSYVGTTEGSQWSEIVLGTFKVEIAEGSGGLKAAFYIAVIGVFDAFEDVWLTWELFL